MSEKLTTPQAAAYIGVTPGTLTVWRCNRVAHQPPYYKVGRKVVYDRALLDEYLTRNQLGNRGGDISPAVQK